jgi:hypothetical protein
VCLIVLSPNSADRYPTTMPSLPDRPSKPNHAVFLVHGLWGNKAHFWYVEEQLKKAFPLLKIHACALNEGNKTYDGIDVGADRVLVEVHLHPDMEVNPRSRRRWPDGRARANRSPSSPSSDTH